MELSSVPNLFGHRPLTCRQEECKDLFRFVHNSGQRCF
jgi:hypothetical protein